MEFLGKIIVSLITAFLGPTAVEYVKLKMTNKKEDPIKRDLEFTMVISEELDEMLEKIDADRVWIGIFHNGAHYIHSRKSMQKLSVMLSNTKIGISSNALILKDLPTSLFNGTISHLLNEGFIEIRDIENSGNEFSGLLSVYQSTGTESGYIIGLFDIVTDDLIGILGFDFMDKVTIDGDDKTYISQRSHRLAGYISNFIKI